MNEPSDEITHNEAKNARVPTELHCPVCKTLHVDQDEWAHQIPHRKHLCANCRHIWQPYAVGTVGVDFHVQCRAAREAADIAVAELRRQIDDRVADYEKIRQLEHDLAWTRAEWSNAGAEIAKLEQRRDELLELVAKLSQTVPLESEVAEALQQRGVLLAEIGTLKATIAEYEPVFVQALNDRALLDDVMDGIHRYMSGPFQAGPIPNTAEGLVNARRVTREALDWSGEVQRAVSERNKLLVLMVAELQKALNEVCDVATTPLPEDRERVLAAREVAKKPLPPP